jgi:hypothetical protein
MRLLRIAFTALCLSSSAASAECPTASDLASGIRVNFADGLIIEYVEREPGVLDEAEIDPVDGSVYHIVTERGILEIENYNHLVGEDEDTDFIRFEYDFDKDAVFPLDPGKSDGGMQIGYDENGNQIDKLFVRYTAGVPGDFSIGDCSYEKIPVQINMNRDGSLQVVTLAYLPEIGMSVIEGFYELGQDPFLYVPLSIEAIEKGSSEKSALKKK